MEELEAELTKAKQEADAAKQEAATARIRMVKKLHEHGASVDEIREISGYTVEQIRGILRMENM